MVPNLGRKLFTIFVTLAAASVALFWPGRSPIPLGLDLKGGSRLVYRLDIEKAKADGRIDPLRDSETAIVEKEQQILQERIDKLGLRDIPIQRQGNNELLIELPGMGQDEVESIKSILQNLGELEFRIVADASKGDSVDVADETRKLEDWQKANPGLSLRIFNRTPEKDGGPRQGYRWYPNTGERGLGPNSLIRLEKQESWIFRGDDLAYAVETAMPGQGPVVSFGMKESRKADFEDFTKANVGRSMAIILNGEVRSAPNIKSALPGGGVIEGNFTLQEVQALTKVLLTGSLPIKPELQSETSVGATLGQDAIERAKLATWICMILIPVFMMVYYSGTPFWFSSGVNASISLFINLFLILGAMAFFRATLTLPGIGGLILTVGMAVDADILIFERIREEREKGRSMLQAVQTAFERAGVTIIDSNLTTLISGLILFWFGSGPVKGFAVTLCIGILTTLFSTLLVSKVLFHIGLAKGWIQDIKYLRLWAQPKLKFLKFKWLAGGFSALLVILSLTMFFSVDDNEKLGLDFTGGVIVRTQLSKPAPIDEIRTRVNKVYTSASVNQNHSNRISDADFLRGISDEFTIKFKLSEEERKGEVAGKDPNYLQDLRTALSGLLIEDGIADLQLSTAPNSPKAQAGFLLNLQTSTEDAKLRTVLGRVEELGELKLEKNGEDGKRWKVTGTVSSDLKVETLRSQLLRSFAEAAVSGDSTTPRLLNPFPEHNQLGARVVSGLRDQALRALFLAFFGIVLYVRFRFHEFRWGIAAVVAIFHDVAVAMGAVVLVHHFGWVSAEIDLTMLAAFLTIIGYSVNDTIVIFDRIRENGERSQMGMQELMDLSINQTLSRTILTASTVLAVVTVMFFCNYGRGNVLEGFAFSMMVGTIAGCYSTIYVASPVVLYFVSRDQKKNQSATKNPVAQSKALAQK